MKQKREPNQFMFGQRAIKRRTYNFTRDEVIDHRSGVKVKGIAKVLNGDISVFQVDRKQEQQKDD